MSTVQENIATLDAFATAGGVTSTPNRIVIGNGGQTPAVAGAALVINANATPWSVGLMVSDNATTPESSSLRNIIALGYAHQITWRTPGGSRGASIESEVTNAGDSLRLLFQNDALYVLNNSNSVVFHVANFAGTTSSSGTNYLRLAGTTSPTPPELIAAGPTADIDLRLTPKGNGSLLSTGKAFSEHANGGASDEASYHFRRRATYSGGTPGFVNAGLKVSTFVESSPGSGTSSAAAFEWGFLSDLDNYSTAGEMVAINGTARARPNAGATWAGNLALIDYSTGNPTQGRLGLELNIDANGTDNNNNRIGIDIAARRRGLTGTAMEASFGIRFQNGGDAANSLFKTLVGMEAGTRATEGFCTHAGTLTGAAFKMAQGQFIAFNAGSTRQLEHNGGGFNFRTAGATLWALNDDGSLVVNGTQILGGRNTGWTAPTGTLTSAKGAFNADTATLIDTARRLAALDLALRGHGLIGT